VQSGRRPESGLEKLIKLLVHCFHNCHGESSLALMECLLLTFHALRVEALYIKCIPHALGRVDFNLSFLGSPCCAPDICRRLTTDLDDLKSTGVLAAPPMPLCLEGCHSHKREPQRGRVMLLHRPLLHLRPLLCSRYLRSAWKDWIQMLKQRPLYHFL
jgi:hypothetical protein